MHTQSQKNKELHLKLDAEALTPTQLRLIKSIHALLANVVATEDEAEYFEMSAELMKKTAEAIKHSSFAEAHKSMNYGTQAIEYSVDTLSEAIEESDLKNFDN